MAQTFALTTVTAGFDAKGFDLGDGSDGALQFIAAGSTAVAGATLSSGVYTLTRDIFASAITLDLGVTIKPAGYRIRCLGAITNTPAILDKGFGVQTIWPVISDNGNAASTTTAGAALTAAGSLHRISMIGGAQAAPGTQGTAATWPSFGGFGGAGGSQASHTDGGAQSAAPVQPTGIQATAHELYFANYGILNNSGNQGPQYLTGGAGGAGGAQGGSAGGSGGGGGGVIYIAAGSIVAGAGLGFTIEALGGAGGAGVANYGSGGGGGGGVLILATRAPVVSGSQYNGVYLNVNGGAAGAQAGTATLASAGGAGTIFLFSPQAY